MNPALTLAPCSPTQLRKRLEESAKLVAQAAARAHPWTCDTDAEYRKLEAEGLGVFNKPVHDTHAEEIDISATTGAHRVPLRIIKPHNGDRKGILLYIHGGGWVVGSARLHDDLLRKLAERTGLVVAAVEYRLGPTHKIPAGLDDCVDAAEFLISPKSQKLFGGRLKAIVGESAGGTLTVQTALALRDRGVDVRSELAAIVPLYGLYDMSLLPKAHEVNAVGSYLSMALPGDLNNDRAMLKTAEWSPLYADLTNLPPALFAVGTEDDLLDDSLLLAPKWQLAGNESSLKVYPGTPHGFIAFDLDATEECLTDTVAFINSQLNRNT